METIQNVTSLHTKKIFYSNRTIVLIFNYFYSVIAAVSFIFTPLLLFSTVHTCTMSVIHVSKSLCTAAVACVSGRGSWKSHVSSMLTKSQNI